MIRAIADHADGGEVLVVVPALNSRLAHYTSDTARAVADAEARLAKSIGNLQELELGARDVVGDADPLGAIDDALSGFAADEMIIATHRAGESNWLEQGVIDRARERWSMPLTHLIIDTGIDVPDASPG